MFIRAYDPGNDAAADLLALLRLHLDGTIYHRGRTSGPVNWTNTSVSQYTTDFIEPLCPTIFLANYFHKPRRRVFKHAVLLYSKNHPPSSALQS